MSTKYEILLERTVRAIEEQINISKALIEISKGLQNNTKELNDFYTLTVLKIEEICQDVKLIRQQLLKWVKVLGVLLLLAVGGASVLKISGFDLTSLF